MKLLFLPEVVTRLWKPMALHMAASYVLAVLEDVNWSHNRGALYDKAEEEFNDRVYAIAYRRRWQTIHRLAEADFPAATMPAATQIPPSKQVKFVKVVPMC
ncbi:hypothetical protein MTO96_041545 [Rhipicephalus appendiculatus]